MVRYSSVIPPVKSDFPSHYVPYRQKMRPVNGAIAERRLAHGPETMLATREQPGGKERGADNPAEGIATCERLRGRNRYP